MPSVSRPPPLPGFGLDRGHNYNKGITRFPHGLVSGYEDQDDEARLPVLTLREIAMVQFMNQITDENGWEEDIFDEAIIQMWITDAVQRPGADFTREMADYCISELKYKAELIKKAGFVRVYNGEAIKSDSAIPAQLQAALKAAVAPLERVPAHKKDWQPGSDNQVLNLVDPSLFPLVYGTSRILTDRTVGLEDCVSMAGEGEIIPACSGQESFFPECPAQLLASLYSWNFQWLPCDVDISGETPRIVSYINNLHPEEHAQLYEVIEKYLEKILPLWNATLTPLRTKKWKRRIVHDTVDYGDLDACVEKEGPRKLVYEDYWDFQNRLQEWKRDRIHEFIVQPNPGPFLRDDEDDQEDDVEEGNAQGGDYLSRKNRRGRSVDLRKEYLETGLQVIVKLTNVHLTPEKPIYDGDSNWRIEGQLNDQICATAIYCYDIENITSSHLAFRQASDDSWAKEDPFQDGDHGWLKSMYGLRKGEYTTQILGTIQNREGRVVTFSNLLQKREQSFELADKTKSGHCKTLSLFLVDSNIKIISTANIPCQQRDWWGKAIVKANDNVLGRLPVELKEKIIQEVEDGFPLSLEQAKRIREQLIQEQKGRALDFNFNYQRCQCYALWQ